MKKTNEPTADAPRKTGCYLVTGGAGFIGSHLCERFLAKGHRVLVIDNLSTGRIENIRHLLGHERFHFCRSDVMTEVTLDRLASQADTIVHLAATVGVEKIVSSPAETIENNVAGTDRVLRAALRYGCRTLIASTSEVYGKGSKIPFGEDDDILLGPSSKSRWSYAASKLVDEFLALAYMQEYGVPVVILRLFNTVGPRQTGRYGMVIPRLVGQALRNDPITVHGDGKQSRCFCHVADVVRAIDQLCECPAATGQVINIGSRTETAIGDLAGKIKAITASSSEIRFVPYHEAYAPGFEDMQRRLPDTSRIEAMLGWQPEIGLDEILRQVMDHIKGESAA